MIAFHAVVNCNTFIIHFQDLCPTTLKLKDALSTISSVIASAAQMLLDMIQIESEHCSFTIQDKTKITVGFHSRILLKHFFVRINFAHGLEKVHTYQSCVEVISSIGDCPTESQIRALVEKSEKGWRFVKSFVRNVDKFLMEEEKKIGR